MNRMMPGANLTIFVLFFGISLIDALVSRNWLRSLLWLAFGLLFLRADIVGRGRRSQEPPD